MGVSAQVEEAADAGQGRVGELAAFPGGNARINQREFHIAQRVGTREQVESLEDEADLGKILKQRWIAGIKEVLKEFGEGKVDVKVANNITKAKEILNNENIVLVISDFLNNRNKISKFG